MGQGEREGGKWGGRREGGDEEIGREGEKKGHGER